MDGIVLAKKVDSILRCLNRIEQRIPATESAFLKDYDAQDVVVLILLLILYLAAMVLFLE